MRILLIEDDDMLGKATAQGLGTVYAVDWVKTAEEAELAIQTTPYDLLVLDINLPGKSGLDLLRELRGRNSAYPCLLLTARDAVRHRVDGLNAGADDYLVKPFDLDELIARCRALIRRGQGRATASIKYGSIEFDVAARQARKEGRIVPLSARELDILEVLFGNIGKIISKQQIESKIYDWSNEDIASNTVEVHVSALRRKLGKELISTVRNVGYMIPGKDVR